jgi:MFS family permease
MTTTIDTPSLRAHHKVHAWVAAAGISAIGDRVWQIALAWTAVRVASPGIAGLVIGSSTVSRALLMLVGGALADRMATRPILILTNTARIVILAIGLGVVTADGPSLPLLVCVSMAFGAVDALGNPAMGTMPRQMVQADDLGPASAMFDLAGRTAMFVGAPLGGVLIAAGGLSASLLVDLVSFVVIGLVIWTLLRPRFPIVRKPSESMVRELRDALSYVGGDQSVRTVVIALCGLNVFVSPALAVGVALRVHSAGWPALWLGITDAALGVGGAAGALIGMRWRPQRPATTGFLLLAIQGVAVAAIGVPVRGVIITAAAIIGLTAGSASAMLSGVFLSIIHANYLGRVGSLNNLTDQALMPAAMALFGVAAATIGITTTAAISGMAMTTLVLWSASRPAIRALRRA